MAERLQWKDISSYSKGDKERVPTAWELQLSRRVRIVVVRGHIYRPDSWVFHCDPWFDTCNLDLAPTHENRHEAMSRALALVRREIEKLTATLREIN